MADKKPLVAGQSPAVVQQIGSSDTLDVPEIKLGEPLAPQYGGLGVDPSGWVQFAVPAWNALTSSFVAGIVPVPSGAAGEIQYKSTAGGFASSPALSFNAGTATLNLHGALYVALGGGDTVPRMQMWTFADKIDGYTGWLRFQTSILGTPVEFKFTGTAIETPNEFRAHRLSLTYNGSATQTGGKTSPVTIHGSKFTITTGSSTLAAYSTVSFLLTNNVIKDADAMIFVSHVSGGTVGAYNVSAEVTGPNTAVVRIRNNAAGALSQALVLKGVVIG